MNHVVKKSSFLKRRRTPEVYTQPILALDKDDPCRYSLDFFLTDLETRTYIGLESPKLSAAKLQDWQRLYEYLSSVKGLVVCKPDWISDDGTVLSNGSFAMYIGYEFSTQEPLPIKRLRFAYPKDTNPMFTKPFLEHVAPWLWPLLDEIMIAGGEFGVYSQKMQCRENMFEPLQLRLDDVS